MAHGCSVRKTQFFPLVDSLHPALVVHSSALFVASCRTRAQPLPTSVLALPPLMPLRGVCCQRVEEACLGAPQAPPPFFNTLMLPFPACSLHDPPRVPHCLCRRSALPVG